MLTELAQPQVLPLTAEQLPQNFENQARLERSREMTERLRKHDLIKNTISKAHCWNYCIVILILILMSAWIMLFKIVDNAIEKHEPANKTFGI